MIRTDWLDRQAHHTPDAVALVWEPTGVAWTYEALDVAARALAAGLAQRGLRRGDRLAILAENTLEHVLLFIACQKTGVVLVPLNYRLTASELAYIVQDSDPALLFYQDRYADVAHALPHPVPRLPLDALTPLFEADPGQAPVVSALPFEDPLLILYTSGTTGRPKGALITHGMLAWNSFNTGNRLALTGSDVSFNAAPFYHVGAWNVLLTPFLHRGATTYLLDRFDADRLLALCDAVGITILWGVPTMLQLMAQSPRFAETSLASVRYAVVGGEPMPEPLIRTWQAKGIPIRQGFGMTEVGVNCFSLPERDALRKIGSIGFPNFYLETRVVDDAGHDVPPDTPGELLMRGPVVTPGYWRNPEATAAAFRDGWFATGDLVRVDAEGYFYVVGRKKEMYISGGENVYPAEVEAVFYTHPAVAEVAVVGMPDAQWGEAGCAFIVVQPGAAVAEADLLAHARAHLAKYKVPRTVRFRADLPKGHSGKILKRVLQDEARDHS